jgi:hypothetical protein
MVVSLVNEVVLEPPQEEQNRNCCDQRCLDVHVRNFRQHPVPLSCLHLHNTLLAPEVPPLTPVGAHDTRVRIAFHIAAVPPTMWAYAVIAARVTYRLVAFLTEMGSVPNSLAVSLRNHSSPHSSSIPRRDLPCSLAYVGHPNPSMSPSRTPLKSRTSPVRWSFTCPRFSW